MAIHVSVHDVSPAWSSEIEAAVDMARAHGAKPALLVVPNFHGRWPLLDHPEFCRWLARMSREGCETYLHGFFHESRELAAGVSLSGRMRHTFAQRVVSNGEAEFASLAPDQACERLDQGERVLTRAGVPLCGFVPPAWSMQRATLHALARRGYRYSEDHLRIHDPAARKSRSTLVLNYATRSTARMLATVAFCRGATPLAATWPTRIAIHPADMRKRLVREELELLLARFEGRYVERAADMFT